VLRHGRPFLRSPRAVERLVCLADPDLVLSVEQAYDGDRVVEGTLPQARSRVLVLGDAVRRSQRMVELLEVQLT